MLCEMKTNSLSLESSMVGYRCMSESRLVEAWDNVEGPSRRRYPEQARRACPALQRGAARNWVPKVNCCGADGRYAAGPLCPSRGPEAAAGRSASTPKRKRYIGAQFCYAFVGTTETRNSSQEDHQVD